MKKLIVSVVLTTLLAGGGSAFAAGATIVPHRAVYDVMLESARERAGIHDARGRLVMEISGRGCEGWTLNTRFVKRVTLRRGTTFLLDHRNSSFESTDGRLMQFFVRDYVNGKLHQEAKGTARMGTDGGEVNMTRPREESFSLPANTVFPISHTVRLLKLARKGGLLDEVSIYEDFFEQKVFIANSTIGRRKAAGEREFRREGKHRELLGNLVSWPINVSFYDPANKGEGEETPSYQASFALFDNGITGDTTIDYGDFKLRGTLTDLELLDDPECE